MNSDNTKQLVIIRYHGANEKPEETNPTYAGYKVTDKTCEFLFATNNCELFRHIKKYTDKDYAVLCLNKDEKNAFIQSHAILDNIKDTDKITIWRYNPGSPFSFGKSTKKPVKTNVMIKDCSIRALHKGYVAVEISNGPAKGIYELRSGGLVGSTVDEVNKDIDACKDISVMESQIEKSGEICRTAAEISNRDFGIITKGKTENE